MSMTIIRRNDRRIATAFAHRVADIPNGVTVVESELTQSILYEGTPLGKDANGKYHVIKTAELTAQAANDATVLTVKKGHNFKVGELVFAVKGGKCYAITAIATNSEDAESDDITIGTTLGVALKVGDVIYLGAESGASKGAFKYEPIAVVGENYDVDRLTNLMVNAWVMGVLFESRLNVAIGDVMKAALSNVKFV